MKRLYLRKGRETSGSDIPPKDPSVTYFYYVSERGEIVWPPQSSTGALDQFEIIDPIVDTTVYPQTGLGKKSKAEHEDS